MQINLRELDVHNIGAWPVSVKAVAILGVCVILAVAGYWYDLSIQQERLIQTRVKEVELKKEFAKKHHQASNLEAYRKQYQEMKADFSKMLKQLPSETEVPGLLEDISQRGIASGLEFKLIKPMPEIAHDFYVSLPIHMIVIGNYHEFAQFVSEIAKLPRIVTVGDFSIRRLKPSDIEVDKSQTTQAQAKTKTIRTGDNKLIMDIVLETYRYTGLSDENENVTQ